MRAGLTKVKMTTPPSKWRRLVMTGIGLDKALRSGADRNRTGGGAAFDRPAGEILGKLAVPFAGLRRNGALGSRSFFCSTTQIETLV